MAKEAENIFERNWTDASVSERKDSEKMKSKVDSLLIVTGLIGAIPIMAYISYLRFKYPDLTQVRFFITFWKYELISIVFLVLFGIGSIHKAYRLGRLELEEAENEVP
jgi:hypothetical protein